MNDNNQNQYDKLKNSHIVISNAFLLGYENWYNPQNPFPKGSAWFSDYEAGVKLALNEQS